MKAFITLLRMLFGAFFIFSGFVKAVDPLGTSYKFQEYFAELGLEFLSPAALFFAVVMIAVEIILGYALIIGWQKKLTTVSILLLIIIFTFLTGYTSVTGKVTDCGCFGDFLKLEPIESFIKDLVLMVLILILLAAAFAKKELYPKFFPDNPMLISVVVVSILSFGFCYYNFGMNLPVIDFRPYAIGNSITDQMVAEKDAVVEYEFVYKNRETGETKAYAMDALGTVDNAKMEFVERRENVIDPGIPAKIINFYVENMDGEEVTEDLLYDENHSFMIVAYDLDKTDADAFIEKLNPLAQASQDAGHHFYAISAATDPEAFRHDVQAAYPFYYADATFLKTIIRSNPGLVLIKNGVVKGKWHKNHIPNWDELSKQL